MMLNYSGRDTSVHYMSLRALFAPITTLLLSSTLGASPAVADQQMIHGKDDRANIWKPAVLPAPVAQTEGYVDVGNGIKLWYWDTGGNGEPVILMHAGTGSGAFWGYQQPVLTNAGYRVIGYSRRGYYRSDAGDKEEPGIGAEDLEKVLDQLEIEKAHIVAAAHGGYFALDFVLDHPKRTLSFTSLSSMLGISDEDYLAVGRRIRPNFFDDLPHSFQELGPSYRAGYPEGLKLWEELAKQAIPSERIEPKLSAPITWERISSLAVPTLLVTGDSDLYLPPAQLRMQATHMPNAEVRIVREAGHASNWEQPEMFNALLLDFLKRNSGE